jgi:hypothetical protein
VDEDEDEDEDEATVDDELRAVVEELINADDEIDRINDVDWVMLTTELDAREDGLDTAEAKAVDEPVPML